jgi:tetratricopeptide (TPR) repeat protein
MKQGTGSRAILLAACAAGIAFAAPGQTVISSTISVVQETEIPSSQPSDPALKECIHLIEQRDYAAASQKIHAYLAAHADSAEGHFLFGYVLYRQDKPLESLAEYTLGARFHKPDANDLAAVAMDYILLHDYADADKWLTIATSWSPENELYWYYLGRTKYAENRFQQAIDVFGKCLTLAPRDVRAKYNMGLAYAGLGRDDAAAADYRTAIAWEEQAAGRDPQPYLDLGTLLLQQGKPDLALPNLEKATALDAQNPRAREQLGQAYEQLHNLARADEEMHVAIELAPNISSLHFEMGRIYQKEGLSKQAKAEFARCAALNPSHSTDAEETPNPVPHE